MKALPSFQLFLTAYTFPHTPIVYLLSLFLNILLSNKSSSWTKIKSFKNKLHLGQGANIAEVSKQLGVTEQTYYRWRKEYGGLFICLLSNTTSFPKARGKGID
jgi:hypothetical protein